ncbi:MAG: prepilin-type N-terminal cleavage/methylation domain-containing protein [Candidatus Saccharimonadales bacterium]|nr:prepilin-type N-terminal cleavage/methylation domain-containing protein [Candidatus Saccharimonadales bacterium]
MKNTIRTNNQGFTLIELILALAFFSFVLLFAIAGFVQINRSYNKGITVKRVHESGRLVIEDIARVIRTSQGPVDTSKVNLVGTRRFCVGGVRFAWNEIGDGASRETFFNGGGKMINLSRTQSGACTDPINEDLSESYLDLPSNDNDPNKVPGGVVVYDLNFIPIPGDAVRIELILASSDPLGDLVEDFAGFVSCKGGIIDGDQFCDVVELSTTVSLRS